MALCLLLVSTTNLNAQANAGVTGTVTDQSGAVIPNANVTITNQGTSISTHAITSNVGVYAVTGLTPGHYSITVEASGFKKSVQNDVPIDVASQATINATLANGSASETVEVTENAVALNTTQPQLGTTIEPEVVRALPTEVSGRDRQVDSLQFLTPGAAGNSFSHTISGGVDFEQEILYNGIPVPQSETEGYTTNFNPPYELVSEFTLQRTTFSAQYGLGQGALTYQMAPGTNQFHGDVFEINRNSLFDSAGFFNSKAQGGTGSAPTDHENNYGFTVGGPVWIPKVYNGHDRTFFHYSQDWYKQNNVDTSFGTVPSAKEKNGDFTDFFGTDANKNTVLIPIYDPDKTLPGGAVNPNYGKQFQYNGQLNVIPPDRISANSKVLIPSIPNPDRAGTGPAGLITNKGYAPFVNPHIQHNWGFTVDHNLSPTKSLHYSEWRNNYSNFSFDTSPIVVQPNPLNSMKYEPARGTVFLLSYTDAFTPHLVMTAGAGWIGELNNQFNQTTYSFPAVQQGIIPPEETWDGQNAPTQWGTSGAWVQSINRKLGLSFVNNWLWTKGRNTFNIGGEARRTYQDDNEEQTAGGHFSFSHNTTSVPNTNDPNFGNYGSSFASFMIGDVDAANRSNSQELRLRNFDISPYIQDDIKLTPRLTVNVGVRWDVMVPFTENNNLIVFFDPNASNPAANGIKGAATKFGNCTGCAGYNRADIDWKHVAPRFGFAYQLNAKTVLQGGFSISFLNGGAYEYGTNKVAVNYGNLLTGSFNRNSTGNTTPAFGNWDSTTLENPPTTAFNPGLGVGTQINGFSKDDGFAPYAQQWNVNVQRELPYNMYGALAYVGNRVVHLPSQDNQIQEPNPATYLPYGSLLSDSITDPAVVAAGFTPPYPEFVAQFGTSATLGQALIYYPQFSNIFNNFEHMGSTAYNGLQAQLEKRFTSGLAFLTSYTLSRTMSTGDSGFSSFVSSGLNKYNQKPEWSVSTNDETHNFKFSGTYELPIGPGKPYVSHKGLIGELTGGWQIGWIADYESGVPFGVNENGAWWPNGGQTNFDRPNRIGSVHLSTASYSKERDFFLGKVPASGATIFQTNGFAPTPTQYAIGDASRSYSSLRQPPGLNENLNAIKRFTLGEHVKASLQVDYFNAFNRTRFNGPDTNVNDSNFGQAITAGPNAYNNAQFNRQGQATFRIEF